MPKRKLLKLALWFPGQAIKAWPNIDSLKADASLAGLVGSCWDAFKDAVGEELATDVLKADKMQLEENTVLGQLRSFYVSTVMWLSWLNYTSRQDEPTAGELMKEGLLEMQLSGDSVGFNHAAHAPGPGHLHDQMQQLQLAAKNTLVRGELMFQTPHDYSEGGMAAVTRLSGGAVYSLVERVNRQLGHEGIMQLVKHNAPKLKIVAGPRDGHEIMAALVSSKGGKVVENVSPYWFHHSLAMGRAGLEYRSHLAKSGIGTPSPLLTFVSYVTGRIVRPGGLIEDLAQGVWKPVHFYTVRGASVHGAAHKNGFYDTVILNAEIRNWLSTSRKIAPHLVTNHEGLQALKNWTMQVINGEAKPGKQRVVQEQAAPSLQPAPGSLYRARS